MDHTVKDGETISTIAERNGFFWETVWNDPGNAALRDKRQNPAGLVKGDVVRIPAVRAKTESGETTLTHVFRKKTGGVVPRFPTLGVLVEVEEPPLVDVLVAVEAPPAVEVAAAVEEPPAVAVVAAIEEPCFLDVRADVEAPSALAVHADVACAA